MVTGTFFCSHLQIRTNPPSQLLDRIEILQFDSIETSACPNYLLLPNDNAESTNYATISSILRPALLYTIPTKQDKTINTVTPAQGR